MSIFNYESNFLLADNITIENVFHHSKNYLRYNRTSYALIVNTLNSQNRKYVNTTSSVILAYAIALAPLRIKGKTTPW